MPAPEQVLSGLREIANAWKWLAILWHVILALLVVTLAFGVRPTRRIVGILTALPLLSVSALAWGGRSPFNGTIFGLVGIAVIAISAGLGETRVVAAAPSFWLPGILMIAFGWIYPHFLGTASLVPYLYSAPMGLIPCPTLSVVVGLGLVFGGLRSRAWTYVVSAVGLFYGYYGAKRLGVRLDWVLVFGALWLLGIGFQLRREARPVRAASG
jgi:hypothetical protein